MLPNARSKVRVRAGRDVPRTSENRALVLFLLSDCEAVVDAEPRQQEAQAADDVLSQVAPEVDRRIWKALGRRRDHQEKTPQQARQPKYFPECGLSRRRRRPT